MEWSRAVSGEVCAAVSFRCVLRAVPRAGLLVEFFRVVEICVVSRIKIY